MHVGAAQRTSAACADHVLVDLGGSHSWQGLLGLGERPAKQVPLIKQSLAPSVCTQPSAAAGSLQVSLVHVMPSSQLRAAPTQ